MERERERERGRGVMRRRVTDTNPFRIDKNRISAVCYVNKKGLARLLCPN